MLKYAPNSFMGINYNSPTVQNMMQQPYSMTPNIGNIGGMGYNSGGNPYLEFMNSPQYNQIMNGGYYSGFYSYDPIQIREQIEQQQRAEQARIRNGIEIQIMRDRIYNNFHGYETDEKYLEKLYDPSSYTEINKDLSDYEEMLKLSQISNDPQYQLGLNNNVISAISRISSEIREKTPVTQSFEDFMQTAGELYSEALVNENIREMKRNIGNTYNKEAYNQLANMHRQSSSFASLRQNVSVDDLSISLPAHLRGNKEYQERKNAFLNYITQNDVRNRGGL